MITSSQALANLAAAAESHLRWLREERGAGAETLSRWLRDVEAIATECEASGDILGICALTAEIRNHPRPPADTRPAAITCECGALIEDCTCWDEEAA